MTWVCDVSGKQNNPASTWANRFAVMMVTAREANIFFISYNLGKGEIRRI